MREPPAGFWPVNPPAQQPISNEVLLTKIQGFFDQLLAEMGHLRKELVDYEGRLHKLEDHEALSVEWHHVHETSPSHPDLQRKHLDFEMALGKIKDDINIINAREAQRRESDSYQKGVKDGMARTLSWADKGYVFIAAMIPTVILIYNVFS